MKTLNECLRNRPLPVVILSEYKSKRGINYFLCKTEENNIHYFMEGIYVIKKETFNDNLEELYVKSLNGQNVKDEMNKLKSYNAFKQFIKERCGEELC